MNAPEARRQLSTAANPDAHSDYVVGIEIETPPLPGLGGVRVALRYVPDKLILRPACLEGYLSALACPQWTSLEALALALRRRPIGFYLRDCSALVTATLLAIASAGRITGAASPAQESH